ncbi:MAG: SpoIIE family protein phosphatase [Candidatus Promineifilaceae bacterium]
MSAPPIEPFGLWQQGGVLAQPGLWLIILLLTLSLAAAVLYRRYTSRRRLMARVAELEALSSAGRAILAARLDLSDLCDLIAQQASQIIDTSTFQIGLFSDSLYEILYWTIEGVRQPTPAVFEVSGTESLIGWLRQNQQSLRVRDFRSEMASLPARPSYESDFPPRSAIFIPLMRGNEAIGLLAAQSSRPAAFRHQDEERLEILANQAAAAIANAYLYEQERERASYLELVSQIARQVNAINDLDELFSQVVNLTRVTFSFGSVNIFTIDPSNGDAVIRASSLPSLEAGGWRLPAGEGLIGGALATRDTMLSNNTQEDQRFLGGGVSAETRSEIVIPLVVDDDLLGLLDVQSVQLGAFTSVEQTVLEALAAQVAIAIHKAQQFALQREQAWITTAQLQVAESISQSPDLDSLSESVTRLTALLVGVDQAALLVWDGEYEVYRPAAVYGVPAEVESAFCGREIESGAWRSLDAAHVGMERRVARRPPPWLRGRPDALPANLILPLVSKGDVEGALIVGSQEALSPSRDELLRNIAAQAAQALESICLQRARQEEAWVNTALLQVAEAVNRLTDLEEILSVIVRMVPLLVGVRSCVVLIWDEEEQTFRPGPGHGLSEMGHGLLGSFQIDLSEFPLVESQDVERVGPDASYYTFRLPRWMQSILDTETADVFPLHARGRLVGALVVGPPDAGRALSDRQLNILTGIAQQAAVAVVNDQLYREAAERSRIEQELDVARSIQASLMPEGSPDIPGCTVASLWQAARQVGGDFYDFMPLRDGRWGIAIADVADKGVPAALFMALSRTILRTVAFSREQPKEVLERGNQIIYGDTSSDLFVTVFYAVWNPRAKTLTYANGGHNPPLLVSAGGKIDQLRTDGIALGVLEQAKIAQAQVNLRPGDMVVFYTDGVTEAINEDFDEFGLARLCHVAQQTRQGQPADVLAAITQAVVEHAGEKTQFDDMTMVVLKVDA